MALISLLYIVGFKVSDFQGNVAHRLPISVA